ncbi:MAG: hypothetical protein H6552_00475 [Chitinophagales bacterium]|nr:hypothetical protein [Chitinophagales bacterium]
MTDKQFQKAIDEARDLLIKYHQKLKVAEDEYERRYGCHPSDVNDDEWIDALHVVGIPITVEQVEKSVEYRDR